MTPPRFRVVFIPLRPVPWLRDILEATPEVHMDPNEIYNTVTTAFCAYMDACIEAFAEVANWSDDVIAGWDQEQVKRACWFIGYAWPRLRPSDNAFSDHPDTIAQRELWLYVAPRLLSALDGPSHYPRDFAAAGMVPEDYHSTNPKPMSGYAEWLAAQSSTSPTESVSAPRRVTDDTSASADDSDSSGSV